VTLRLCVRWSFKGGDRIEFELKFGFILNPDF
jgi:hypothetical protein